MDDIPVASGVDLLVEDIQQLIVVIGLSGVYIWKLREYSGLEFVVAQLGRSKY